MTAVFPPTHCAYALRVVYESASLDRGILPGSTVVQNKPTNTTIVRSRHCKELHFAELVHAVYALVARTTTTRFVTKTVRKSR